MGGFFIPNAQAAITTLTVIAPNGTEEWRGTQNINWSTTGGTSGDLVNIVYSTDNFASQAVIATGVVYNSQPYIWNTTTFPENTNYKVRFIDASLFVYDTSDAAFTVDNTKPVTTYAINPVSPNGLSGWYVTVAPTITLSCSDGAGSGCNNTYYKWDGAALWTTYTAPFLALEGEHTLSFYSDDQATDASGLLRNEETVQTQPIKVDTAVPTVAVTSSTLDGAYNVPDTINVILTFSEPVTTTGTITVTLETGTTDRTCIVIMTGATVGTCTYTVQAGDTSSDLTTNSIVTTGFVLDVAGNAANLTPSSNLAATSAIVIDTTAPSAFTTGAVTVTGGTVVATWWNFTNTGATVEVPFAVDSSLTGGTMQLQAEADGTFENIESANEIFGVGLGSYLGNTISFSLTASQIEALVGFSEGDVVTFRAVITDLAGNSTTGVNSANTFTIDQTLPSINAGTDKEVKALVAQDATTSDTGGSGLNTHTWSKQTGTGTITFGTGTSVNTTISSGTNEIFGIRLTVTDVAGNSAFDDIQFAWDTIAPILVEVTPVPTPTNDTTPNYTFSTDSVKQLVASTGGVITYGGTCSSATINAIAGNNTITFNALANALHNTCTIAVTDAAGNLSLTLPITAFEVDTVMANVSTITTQDTNLDGRVDTAVIVFDDEVKDSTFVASDFTIGGVAATGFVAGTDNDNTIIITHGGIAGTNAKDVIYTPGSATDLAGNTLTAGSFLVTEVDGAKPVLLSARTVTTTTIDLTFSEDLNGGTVTNADFSVAGYTLGAPDAFEVAPGVVRLTVTVAFGTGDTPDVTMSGPVVEDLAGNAAVVPVTKTPTDGVAPVLTVVSISSNNDGDLIAPEWAKVGDTVRVFFVSSETIATPTVTIAGNVAIIDGNALNNWAFTRVMLVGDTQGTVSFSIAFADMAPTPNIGTTVTATIGGSFVFFDGVAPTVNAGTDKEVNALVSQGATVSDPILASEVATYAWTNQTPLVGTITFSNPSGTNTNVDTNISASADGAYTLRLMVTDNAGNSAFNEMIFIWDTTKPEPLTSSPSDGSTGVALAAGTATVTYDEPVVLLDSSRVLLVRDSDGTSYKGTVAVSGLSPRNLNIGYSGLAYGTKYRINVKRDALEDVAGNNVETSWTSYFTTIIDTVVPVINSASAGTITTTGATLSVTTDESATCKYSTTDSAYSSMTVMGSTGGTSHSQAITGLIASTGYDYYVRCQDTTVPPNTMTTSANISFTTLTPAADTTAPSVPLITINTATVNSDSYTISGTAGADTPDPTVRTISVYNGATLAGTAVVPVGQTGWSVLVTLTQNSANSFTAVSADASGNVSAASSAVVITENGTVDADVTPPAVPAITTSAATIDADTITITGTAGADLPSDGTRTITISRNGTVVGSLTLSSGLTNWSFISSLLQGTANSFIANSTDSSGNVSADSTAVVITEAEGAASLAVTGIDTVANQNGSTGFAIADNTFDNGWRWKFHVTVPTSETNFAMKFLDFVSGANVLSAATNIRYYTAQASAASTTASAITIAGANTYPASIVLDSDLSAGTAGRQIDVIVEARVPSGTPGGSYSTSYGVSSGI